MRFYPTEHPDDDILEAHAIGVLPGVRLARVDEHLLICTPCQQRLREVGSFVEAIREAAARLMGTVVVTHATEEGPVRLEAKKQTRRTWRARCEGPQLEGGEEFNSFREAYAYLERSFAKIYPEHRCSARCSRGETGSGSGTTLGVRSLY